MDPDCVKQARRYQGAVARIVELPRLPEKGDCVDWLDAHVAQTPQDIQAELLRLVERAEVVEASQTNAEEEEGDTEKSLERRATSKGLQGSEVTVATRPVDQAKTLTKTGQSKTRMANATPASPTRRDRGHPQHDETDAIAHAHARALIHPSFPVWQRPDSVFNLSPEVAGSLFMAMDSRMIPRQR